MIQDTSTKAFKEAVVPTLSERHEAVIDALSKVWEATNLELSQELGWPINSVTPRIHELREMGIVAEAGKRHCKVSGRKAYVWALNPGQMTII